MFNHTFWGIWCVKAEKWEGQGALNYSKHKQESYIPFLFETKKKALEFNKARGASNKEFEPRRVALTLVTQNGVSN